MSCIDERKVLIEIRPEGIKKWQPSFRERLRGILVDILCVFHLVRFSLHQQVFGLSFGHLWHLLEPALEAACYFILIAVVFRAAGHDTSFAFFFAGVTFWRSHAALVNAGPTFFAARAPQYIQSSLPLRMAYLEMVAGEFLLFIIRFGMLCVFLVAAGVMPKLTWFLGILVAIVMFVFSTTLSLWLSIFGAFFRDLSRFVGHAVWFWWYLSPGLYSLGRVPEWARPFYELNPFAYILPAVQSVLLEGKLPINGTGLLVVLVVSLFLLWLGAKMIQRTAYQLYRDV